MGINFRRPLELFKYFPWRTAASLTVCEGIRAFLDRYGHCSYAWNGEDSIIPFYLDLAKPGFYVDVGCHHPFKGSNTLSLYARGWRGVAVDGNPDLIRTFKRFRPRDTAICAVVSDQERRMTFTLAKAAALSTVSAEFEQKQIGESGVQERIEVTAVTLQTIMMSNNVPARFELLSIDVEDHDYEVLTSFDLLPPPAYYY